MANKAQFVVNPARSEIRREITASRAILAGSRRKMSNTSVETVTSTADQVKLGLAVLVVIAGIVGFSVLGAQPMPVRIGVFVGGLVVAALIVWFSAPGRRTLSFANESYNEAKRVSCPTRQKTTHNTGAVFAFFA